MYSMEDMVTETISIALRQAADTDTFTGADLRVCKALLTNGADASFMGHYDSGEEHGEVKPFEEVSRYWCRYWCEYWRRYWCTNVLVGTGDTNANANADG